MRQEYFKLGLTVRELKECIKSWPERDPGGFDTEVYIETQEGLTSVVMSIQMLNYRNKNNKESADLLLSPIKEQ